MTTIDLSDLMPAPRREPPYRAKRPAPCAGLFGWRKDNGPFPAESREPETAGRDYPAG